MIDNDPCQLSLVDTVHDLTMDSDVNKGYHGNENDPEDTADNLGKASLEASTIEDSTDTPELIKSKGRGTKKLQTVFTENKQTKALKLLQPFGDFTFNGNGKMGTRFGVASNINDESGSSNSATQNGKKSARPTDGKVKPKLKISKKHAATNSKAAQSLVIVPVEKATHGRNFRGGKSTTVQPTVDKTFKEEIDEATELARHQIEFLKREREITERARADLQREKEEIQKEKEAARKRSITFSFVSIVVI